jgi:hypothetical protein
MHHVPVHVARCGDRWATEDGVTLSVLSPCGALFADPGYALISVGRHNVFGHPAATTLATLRSAGAETYRTDLCGATIVEAGMNMRSTTNLRCSAESEAAFASKGTR